MVVASVDCPAANGTSAIVVSGLIKTEYTVHCQQSLANSDNDITLNRSSLSECEASCSVANSGEAIACQGLSFNHLTSQGRLHASHVLAATADNNDIVLLFNARAYGNGAVPRWIPTSRSQRLLRKRLS